MSNIEPTDRKPALLTRLRWLITGGGVALLLVAVLASVKLTQFKAMEQAAAQQVFPPTPVNVVDVLEVDWQPRIHAVGTLSAVNGILVSAEVEGVVRKIHFQAGSRVQAGAPLVTLDNDVEAAQLAAAEAALQLARSSHERAKDLFGRKSISRADLDAAEAGLKTARADLALRRTQLDKKTVYAPFAGKLGIHRISLGQYVEKGEALVSLQANDPLFAEFSLPQQRIADVRIGFEVEVHVDAFPSRVFRGTVTALDPDIDLTTRNVRVQATVPNPQEELHPGMFATIDVAMERRERKLFIPSTAVLHAPYGNSIFVLVGESAAENEPQAVEQRFVRLGIRQGDYVAVIDGITSTDRVIATAPFKLQPGMQVITDNSLLPSFSFDPDPENS